MRHLRCRVHSGRGKDERYEIEAATNRRPELRADVHPDVGPSQLERGQAGDGGAAERVEHHAAGAAAGDDGPQRDVDGAIWTLRVRHRNACDLLQHVPDNVSDDRLAH
jgi:hypothetical protein